MAETERRIIARNRKARHNYHILDTLEVGIVLKGTEIKSIRGNKVSIGDAYCHVKDDELFIINMHIAQYDHGNRFNHDETRTRKLLAHKREIRRLFGRVSQEGLTIIPLSLYLTRGKAKLEIALARGKKSHDKRDDLKQADIRRQIDRVMKDKRNFRG